VSHRTYSCPYPHRPPPAPLRLELHYFQRPLALAAIDATLTPKLQGRADLLARERPLVGPPCQAQPRSSVLTTSPPLENFRTILADRRHADTAGDRRHLGENVARVRSGFRGDGLERAAQGPGQALGGRGKLRPLRLRQPSAKMTPPAPRKSLRRRWRRRAP